MYVERLTELVLALLIHNDNEAKLIRNVLDPEWLESTIQRKFAELAFTFLDTYNEAPKSHDEDLLAGFSRDEQELARKVLENLRAVVEDGINTEYVRTNLEEWVRAKKYKKAVTESLSYLESGQIDEIESLWAEVQRKRFSVFKPGIFLNDYKDLDLTEQEGDCVLLSIPALDEPRQVPHRKEMWQIVGPAKSGKSWGLIHVARQAIQQRFKVLYITLEMSEARVMQRVVQGITAALKRPQDLYLVELQTDELSRLAGMERQPMNQKRPILNEIKDLAVDKIAKAHFGNRLLIKEFPTKALSFQRLRAYLDGLEGSTKYIPDVIILDYGDLMALPSKESRWVELGELWGQLRGLAVERNIMMVTATQTNREGAKSSTGKATDVSGDWSKIATADVTLIYNQTGSEHDLGIARLFVSDGRNDVDKFEVLITQNYALGQFVVDSVKVPYDYDVRLRDAHTQIEV